MSREWSYGIVLRREDGEIHAYSDDLPEAIASAGTEREARREMGEALIAAVRGRIKDGMDLPLPLATKSDGPRVALPAWLAAKASLYNAWKRSGMTQAVLAERIGRSEADVRGILDPDASTGLDRLADAAAALGGRLSIRFEAA